MNTTALNTVVESGWDMTIGAEAVPGSRHLPVYDPVTGQAFAQAPDATLAETDAAIEAAAAAFPAWAALSWDDRAARVRAFGGAIRPIALPACFAASRVSRWKKR
jgi:acyl-CoA reductase-like NAD-dependent aldehyde dehydrogenase